MGSEGFSAKKHGDNASFLRNVSGYALQCTHFKVIIKIITEAMELAFNRVHANGSYLSETIW